ncbi:MAG TPA: A24 family peptidase [Marmoricola sp.]|jgi:leader peptidase (prepilin peptidase)/N-methyltransferase|nr:A24 family peptidase [Marmoricola sp.]
MTWTDQGHPLAALLGLLGGVLVGALLPRVIARIPEPKPEPKPESAPDPESDQGADPESGADSAPPAEPLPPKPLYADLGASSGLALRLAIATGVGAAVLAASIGHDWALLVALPLAPVCVVLGYVDLHTRLLPSRVLLPSHAVAIVLAGAAAWAAGDAHPLIRAVIAMAVVRSVFWVLWWLRASAMGFGDVRLSALLAFGLGYLGWSEVVIGIYAGFIVFVLPGLSIALVRRDRGFLKARIPFGPALVVGALLGVAFGPWIATGLGY